MGTYRIGGLSIVGRFWRRIAIRVFICVYHFIDRRPLLMRWLTACLRLRPVWSVGRTVLVTGDQQVRDVLSRDDDFPLPEKRAAKFLTGPFVLGMSRTPQFEGERAELERVVQVMDAERVRNLSLGEAQRAVSRARTCGSLDIVTDLATPVGCTLIREYFGVGNSENLVQPLRRLGAMIAAPKSEVDKFRRLAEQSASQVFKQIDRDIAEAVGRVGGLQHLPQEATVLDRLVHGHLSGRSGLDLEGVRRNITGVLLPGSALVTRAFCTSLVQLLKHKRLRIAAVAAAHRRDWQELEGYLLEALRFHPVFPVLPRYCPHDTAVPGFKGEYRVKAGQDVFVAVASAMFDRHAELFAGASGGHPAEARVRDARHYRHFGGGAHTCLGQRVALPQMAAMLATVLTLPRLECGSIGFSDDGISPKRLQVTFAPLPATASAPSLTRAST